MAGATKGRTPRKPGEETPIEDEKDTVRERPEETLDEKARRDRQAGDVADDLADFA